MGPRHVLLVAAAAAATAGAELPAGLKPGDPYPGHVLPSLTDGRPLSVAHFRGQKVLLLQFASW